MNKHLFSLALLCFLPLFLTGCEEPESTRYDIKGTYSAEDNTFQGTLDLTYYNDTGEDLTSLAFNLYGNAYREGAKNPPLSAAYHSAYYDKLDYGSMTISSVEGGEGWSVGGSDETLLTVDIPALAAGDKISLSIDFSTKLAKVNHRLGVGEHCVNLANFYPILCVYEEGWQECGYTSVGDPFYSECADYSVEITLPSSYEVASTGTQSGTIKGDQKTVKTEAKGVRDFALVLGNWTVSTEKAGDTVIHYYSLGGENASDYLAIAKESFSYFSETFGAYPYPTLSIVETDFCFGGMEHAGLSMLNEKLDKETMEYAIVHEIAHEWWYEGVGSDQRNHAWMDEGLAEYSCVLFFEGRDSVYTREGVVSTAKKAIRSYVSIYSQLFGKSDTSMDRPNDKFVSEYEYTNLVYNQGIVLFDNLRESIGDKRFLEGLSHYYAAHRGKIATKEDLISSFSRMGVDVQGFFASFLEGKVII
ncbi:MAG: M1 family metallopeptidase [Clostridia bacterium]|nr:M1 family metallopeptidase [Clostridia bacterium]